MLDVGNEGRRSEGFVSHVNVEGYDDGFPGADGFWAIDNGADHLDDLHVHELGEPRRDLGWESSEFYERAST